MIAYGRLAVARERFFQRTCRECGATREASPLELLEGGRCKQCRAVVRAVHEPFAVDKAALDAIAPALPVPILVDIQMPATQEAKAQAIHCDRLARRLDGRGVVLTVDADDHREAAWALGATSTPTLAVMKKGEVIHLFEGFADATLLEEWMRMAFKM
jgi:thioredoxin 2